MRIPEIDKIFNRRLPKKASLDLSINAIVVLVLAIAMLGLGLAFTRSMFEKFKSKLSVPEPEVHGTPDQPIQLPSEELEIRNGKEFTFAVSFYNNYGGGSVEPALICSKLSASGGLKDVITTFTDGCVTTGSEGENCDVLTGAQEVGTGEDKMFKFIVPPEATDSTTLFRDVCQVKFCAPKGPDTPGEWVYTGTYAATCMNGEGETATVGKSESKQIVIRVI